MIATLSGYYFVDLDLGIAVLFAKRGKKIKGFGFDFELGLRHQLHTNVTGVGNFFAEIVCFLFCFVLFF